MKKKMPSFKSEKEEALFWDKKSLLDYPDEVREIKDPFQYALYLLEHAAKEHKEKKRLLTFRMEQSQILLAKIIAKKKGDNYQSLFRKWIREGILRELKGNPEIEKSARKKNLHLVT
jgi:predicted DNA binding CopG/RHH family protein